MRNAIIGVTLALAVASAAALVLRGSPRSTAGDAVGLVELADDSPFRIALGGPLWHDRAVPDGDAQNFAEVATDRPLEVEVRGGARVGVAAVELRVDGRSQRVVSAECPQRRCPPTLRVTFTPRLSRLTPGEHRVAVIARGVHGAVGMQAISVHTVSQEVAVIEGKPVAGVPAADPSPRRDRALERAALRVLESERHRPGLAAALGASRLTVIQVGELTARGRRLGATLQVALAPPRPDVWTTLPAYYPTKGAAGPPYNPQRVRMHVAVLRDALIDIDLRRGRVIAFEPGMRTRSLSWSTSEAPAPAGAGDED